MILYCMLTGLYPFEEANIFDVLKKMEQGHEAIYFPTSLSSGHHLKDKNKNKQKEHTRTIINKIDAIDLLKRIFVSNPDERATIEEIMKHKWMKEKEGEENASSFFGPNS